MAIKLNEAVLKWNKIFDFSKLGTKEQYDLQDAIADAIVASTTKCNLDDYRMNNYGNNGSDQSIVFLGQLYHPEIKNNKLTKKRLSSKEINTLKSGVISKIKLPKNTKDIDYSISVDYSDIEVKVKIMKKVW